MFNVLIFIDGVSISTISYSVFYCRIRHIAHLVFQLSFTRYLKTIVIAPCSKP